MKPAFALDFRNDAIALLHRASGGWHQVGRVTLDDPDLPDALSYLRATALGLSPRGLTTKLILPDDQLLVTTIDAPGPDEASRLAQIRAALEGRTPYAVEDLVFDWEEVAGEVRVAVVARVTLDEAESFAAEHRFNPVSFAAAPAHGYSAEAWFGPSSMAATLVPPDETVERETTRTVIVERGPVADETATTAPEADPDDAHTTETPSAPVAAEEVEAEEVAAEAEEAELATPQPQTPTPTPEPSPPIAADLFSAAEHPAPEAQDHADRADPAPLAAEPMEPAPTRQTPIFGLADDEPPPSQAFRSQNGLAAPAEVSEEVSAELDQAKADDLPAEWPPLAELDGPRSELADTKAPNTKTSDGEAPPDEATQSGALQDEAHQDEAPHDEAPMAVDVEQDDDIANTDPENTPPAADGQSDAASAKALLPGLGFASRRSPAEPGQSGKSASGAARPIVDRPTAARPLVAAPPPKVERPSLKPSSLKAPSLKAPSLKAPSLKTPSLNRTGLTPSSAARPSAPKEDKGLRGLGAFVTAPGLPGLRKKPAEAAPAKTNPAAPSAEPVAPPPQSLGNSLGARPMPMRGKPRHLGLILTALLLLALAIVAAWSTSLAFRSGDEAETQFAAETTVEDGESLPAIDDEMLADGQDPDLLSDEELAAALPTPDAQPEAQPDAPIDAVAEPDSEATAQITPEATPEPASAGVQTPGAVAANPGATAGDEIFLGTSDSAPVTPDPLELAGVAATADPLPPAQAPPPPFGTVYQFDANGLILPTPEGIVTPEGVLLVAGKPPRLPQARPSTLAPAEPPSEPEAASEPADQTTADSQDSAVFADPALAGFRPKSRPEGLTPPAAPATEPGSDPASLAPTGTEGTDDATLSPDAAPLPAAESGLASLRPRARPQTVLAVGESARAAAAAASLAAQAEAAQTEAALAEAETNLASLAPTANTSPLAVSISRKPQPRPRDLSRAVEAAVAAAIRAPEPKPEPEPEELAAAEPPPKKSQSRPRDEDASIYEEPEVEESAPRGTASGSVAKQATFRNALAMDKTALIGVYGTPSQRYAMIRTTNGRYKKVKVGDKVDGGRIQAITASEVRYQKGSRLVTLKMPQG
ncbi:hypothetical protein [Tabrizicola sp.]|uniref:hypothetical protein n=1 Tax=Tabrizicola sp. TaxID=2005166 RepID=UPI003D2917A0